MFMKNLVKLSLLITVYLILSCSSTQIVSSWKDTTTQIFPGDWKKVLVIALLRNETSRRRAEDEMVKYLNGKGIASYLYLGEDFNLTDNESLRNKIRHDDFDVAITIRLIDVDKETVYTPEQYYLYPVYYHNYSHYYYRTWRIYITPGYYTISKKFIVETIIYSISENKIIWSGITETFNPRGVEKMTNEIAFAIHKQMLKEGFVKKESSK